MLALGGQGARRNTLLNSVEHNLHHIHSVQQQAAGSAVQAAGTGEGPGNVRGSVVLNECGIGREDVEVREIREINGARATRVR
jgi:hypothetical protein